MVDICCASYSEENTYRDIQLIHNIMHGITTDHNMLKYMI